MIESPTLRRVANGEAELSKLWQRIERDGAPLVEELPDDPGRLLVTFLFRGTPATRNVVVVGGPAGFDTPANQMQRLGGSELWFRSYRVARGARCLYDISENDSLTPPWRTADPGGVMASWRPDPLNPRRYTIIEVEGRADARSLLELPGAPPLRESNPVPDAARGKLTRHQLASRHLGNNRPIDVYTPPAHHGPPRVLLIVFDGIAFTRTVPTPAILDNLLASGRIPPTAALFVDSLGELRNRELPCHAPFAAFVAEELLAFARPRCGELSAEQVVLAGASYGGVAAAYVARAHPERFGNVLSMSGSFWVKGDGSDDDTDFGWLPRRYLQGPSLGLRFYQNVGLFEAGNRPSEDAPDQVSINRRMRDVLSERGYDVMYREYAGGHDWVCWEQSLPEALTLLLDRA